MFIQFNLTSLHPPPQNNSNSEVYKPKVQDGRCYNRGGGKKEAQAFLETRYMEDDNVGPIGGVEHTCDTVYSLGIRLCLDFFCRHDVLDPEE